MTCQELHRYWEDEQRGAMALGSDAVELAEHAATCSECHRFMEERNKLAKWFALVRDSAPAAPASLDRRVVDSYRRFLSERHRSPVPARSRIALHLPGALGWAAAVAFACAVCYAGMMWLTPHPSGQLSPHAREHQPVVAPQMRSNATPAMAVAPRPGRKIKALASSVRKRKPAISAAEENTSLQTRFHGLIYCDSLSCPGMMDVIRLELPSPVLGLTPAQARANGPVYADVLVGPDGIARAIRVVE